MSTRDQQRGEWLTAVREAASFERDGVDGEWRDHDAMYGLADVACELRTLGDDEAWKAPFNRFRRLFVHRHRDALQHLAHGTGDDAFWLGFMHHTHEAEA